MNGAGFLDQKWTDHCHRVLGALKEFAARHEKIFAGQLRQFVAGQSVDDRANARPVHLADAHRTGFTAGVQHGAANLIGRQLPDGLGDKVGFGVGRRIAIRCDRIQSSEDDASVERQQRSKWMIALAACFAGERNGLADELVVYVQRR
jgi:hypothetical protein